MITPRPRRTLHDIIASHPEIAEELKHAFQDGYQTAMWHHRNKPKPVHNPSIPESAECGVVCDMSKEVVISWVSRESGERMVKNMTNAGLSAWIIDIPEDGKTVDLPEYANENMDNEQATFAGYVASINDADNRYVAFIQGYVDRDVTIKNPYTDEKVNLPASGMASVISHLQYIQDMYQRNGINTYRE